VVRYSLSEAPAVYFVDDVADDGRAAASAAGVNEAVSR